MAQPHMASWLFALAIALLAGAVASSAQAADIVLLERVRASGPVIRLGDIAAVLSGDVDEVDRLSAAALMPAPAPAATRFITVQQVRDLLGAHGWDVSRMRFRGAGASRISGPSTPQEKQQDAAAEPAGAAPRPKQQTGFRLASSAPSRRPGPASVRLTRRRLEELTEELTQKLNDYVRKETGDPLLQALEVELKQRNAQQLAEATTDISIGATTAIGEGLQRFIIQCGTPKGTVKFPVFARVAVARPAVLVKRSVPRGTVITAADVEEAPLPRDYAAPADWTIAQSVEEVIGKEAARPLRAGDVVTDANTLPPLMVERGEVVTVTAGGGGIRVRMQVKAMRDGRHGELIEVQRLETRTRFDARVVGRGELAVLSAGTSAVESVASDVKPLRLR